MLHSRMTGPGGDQQEADHPPPRSTLPSSNHHHHQHQGGTTSKRGFSAQVVLSLCVASYLVGRYVELFADLEKLPEAKGPVVVEISQPDEVPSRRIELDLAQAVQRRASSGEDEVFSSRSAARAFPSSIQQSDIERLAPAQFLLDEPPLQPAESGDPGYHTVPFQVLSWYPRIILFPKFLDHSKCDHIVEIGKKKLGPSGLSLRKGENMDRMRDVRTSSGTFLSRSADPDGVLAEVEDRIAAWTSLPVAHGEPFNLLRYETGQHYDSHYDVFDETYGPQQSQRMATVLVYLTSVEEGGETVFPLEGAQGLERLRGIDYKRCDMGFKYKPVKGDAVLFYSIHPNGTIDKHSLHGGCPVQRGEKWVMTKWLRDKCFGRC